MKKIIIKYVNTVIFLIFINGCSSTPELKIDAINQMSESTTYSYICDTRSTDNNTVCTSTNTNYYKNAYKNAVNCDDKQKVRNIIILDQMGLIDEEYKDTVDRFENSVDYKNFAVHITSLGLSTAATVTGTASVKAIISAIDTGVKGTNTHFDSDVLHNKALNIIKNQMIKDRSNWETHLKGRMSDNKCEYSLEEAKIDLSKYRISGTFDSALSSLESEVGSKAKLSSDKADALSAGTQDAVNASKKITAGAGGADNSTTSGNAVAGAAALTASGAGASPKVVTAVVNAAAASAATDASPAETQSAVKAAAISAGATSTVADTIGKAALGAK
ncbi:MAG: hypothetical protein WCK96_16325 [Methylococcales bacterium]